MLEMLQVLFVALKLLGKIDWSWWLVCLPTIVMFVLAVLNALVKKEESEEWITPPNIRIVRIRMGREENEDDDDKGTEED